VLHGNLDKESASNAKLLPIAESALLMELNVDGAQRRLVVQI